MESYIPGKRGDHCGLGNHSLLTGIFGILFHVIWIFSSALDLDRRGVFPANIDTASGTVLVMEIYHFAGRTSPFAVDGSDIISFARPTNIRSNLLWMMQFEINIFNITLISSW